MATDRTAVLAAHPLRPLVEAHGVTLRRNGAHRWFGCCPFHQERTPSFMVDDSDQHFHCFSCQAHGTVVDWLMRTEKITIAQALRQLGMAPGERQPQPPPRSRQREAQAEFERLVLRLEVTNAAVIHGTPLLGDAAHRYDAAWFDMYAFFARPGFYSWEDWLTRVVGHAALHDLCVADDNGLNLSSLTNWGLLRHWSAEHGWPLWTWLGHECRVRLFDAHGEVTAAGSSKLREKGDLEWHWIGNYQKGTKAAYLTAHGNDTMTMTG